MDGGTSNATTDAPTDAATPAPTPRNAGGSAPAPTAAEPPAVFHAALPCGIGARGAQCRRPPAQLRGSYAHLCQDEVFTAAVMLTNLSHWIIFRNTLYFIACLGTLAVLLIALAVNSHQQPGGYDGDGSMATTSVYAQRPMRLNPIDGSLGPDPDAAPMLPHPPGQYVLHGTNVYYVFRIVWATLSVVIFLWAAGTLYGYWWLVPLYTRGTTGRLQAFWAEFDRTYKASVALVLVYLCWPLVHLCIEIALWPLCCLPWALFRGWCYKELSEPPRDNETDVNDALSCCVRTDNFFQESFQLKRLGFSQGQWRLLTGTRDPYLQFCENGGGGDDGGASAAWAPPPPPPGHHHHHHHHHHQQSSAVAPVAAAPPPQWGGGGGGGAGDDGVIGDAPRDAGRGDDGDSKRKRHKWKKHHHKRDGDGDGDGAAATVDDTPLVVHGTGGDDESPALVGDTSVEASAATPGAKKKKKDRSSRRRVVGEDDDGESSVIGD